MKDKDLESKVVKKADELVICDNKTCSERGDYIRCYFDIHVNCELYVKQKLYKPLRHN